MLFRRPNETNTSSCKFALAALQAHAQGRNCEEKKSTTCFVVNSGTNATRASTGYSTVQSNVACT